MLLEEVRNQGVVLVAPAGGGGGTAQLAQVSHALRVRAAIGGCEPVLDQLDVPLEDLRGVRLRPRSQEHERDGRVELHAPRRVPGEIGRVLL